MKINEVMTRNPKTCRPNAPIQQLADAMNKLDCGFMPIAENGEILGIVTDRDIVIKA
jgi:CBS domain-containing protein